MRREERGLSQRGLALKAGIAYKTLQLLESGRHDPRWSTLVKISRALGYTEPSIEKALSNYMGIFENSVVEVAAKITQEGNSSWKLWLFEFVDVFRKSPEPRLVSKAPDPDTNHGIQAIMASAVEFLCDEKKLSRPWWCAGVPPLPKPWFVSGVENLKASALVESPTQFRQRNIFVLGNFLVRA
ncbi:MAG: helix-turn-helix transcriptional regulator [Elusimicrobia bacterium]|nr:helix-turn-helix transcriptional regulator [Elusimicrobiota bacterium]